MKSVCDRRAWIGYSREVKKSSLSSSSGSVEVAEHELVIQVPKLSREWAEPMSTDKIQSKA
jgi:hypothetical protein